jgi:phosphate transporter
LDKIISLYKIQEEELQGEVDALASDIITTEEHGPGGHLGYSDDGDSDDEELVNGAADGARYASASRRKRSISASSPTARRRRMTLSIGVSFQSIVDNITHTLSSCPLTYSEVTDTNFEAANESEPPASAISNRLPSPTSPEDLARSKSSLRSPTITQLISNPRTALANIFPSANPGPDTVWISRSQSANDTRMLFKRRILALYLRAVNLKSFVELNQTGFRKILKK